MTSPALTIKPRSEIEAMRDVEDRRSRCVLGDLKRDLEYNLTLLENRDVLGASEHQRIRKYHAEIGALSYALETLDKLAAERIKARARQNEPHYGGE